MKRKGTHTKAERAAMSARMKELWAAGVWANRPKPIRPDHWTTAHDRRLRALIGTAPLGEIAAQLSAAFPGTPRTETAVRIRCKRLGLSVVVDHYTATQVGRLFGVDPKTVVHSWIPRGWLEGRQLVPGLAGSAWSITAAQVEAFIREYRHCYDWRAMLPGRWRSLAEIVWRADPLLTVEEAAVYVGCDRETIRRYLRRGLLTGYRRLEKAGDQEGRWLIARSALSTLRVDGPGRPGFTVLPLAEARALVASWQRTNGRRAWAARRQRGAA